MKSAPLRSMTIRDVMGDLPPIKNGDPDQVSCYGSEPSTHFQRLIRRSRGGVSGGSSSGGGCSGGGCADDSLNLHVSKGYAPLVAERMRLIPAHPGADWRDLPNISVKLKNGTTTSKLIYTHHDPKSGKGPGNALRGVCHCVEGKVFVHIIYNSTLMGVVVVVAFRCGL